MYKVKKLPTTISGLLYHPTLEPDFSDDADWTTVCDEVVGENLEHIPPIFSESNRRVLLNTFLEIRDWCPMILEIGVGNSTRIFKEYKKPETTYIGIDRAPILLELNDLTEDFTIHTTDSSNEEYVFGLMVNKPLGLLMIDGWHSINQVLLEWRYTKNLVKGGKIVLHDSNYHPGPVTVIDAVDPKQYRKEKYCIGKEDWGITVLTKLN